MPPLAFPMSKARPGDIITHRKNTRMPKCGRGDITNKDHGEFISTSACSGSIIHLYFSNPIELRVLGNARVQPLVYALSTTEAGSIASFALSSEKEANKAPGEWAADVEQLQYAARYPGDDADDVEILVYLDRCLEIALEENRIVGNLKSLIALHVLAGHKAPYSLPFRLEQMPSTCTAPGSLDIDAEHIQ